MVAGRICDFPYYSTEPALERCLPLLGHLVPSTGCTWSEAQAAEHQSQAELLISPRQDVTSATAETSQEWWEGRRLESAGSGTGIPFLRTESPSSIGIILVNVMVAKPLPTANIRVHMLSSMSNPYLFPPYSLWIILHTKKKVFRFLPPLVVI